MFTLDEDDLETIVQIAERGMSGRVTVYEIKELVRVYRQANRLKQSRI